MRGRRTFKGDRYSKLITIRVPRDLLNCMSRYREKEGVSITFQMCKGAEMYLKEKKAWVKKEEVNKWQERI